VNHRLVVGLAHKARQWAESTARDHFQIREIQIVEGDFNQRFSTLSGFLACVTGQNAVDQGSAVRAD